ncbi:MAG: hypothetical protein ACO1RT_11905, partial [Planctomycetaceae bacterium]
KAPGGSPFDGSWLAAVAPVALPQHDDAVVGEDADIGRPQNTEMLVLVQYRLSKVFEPVGHMQRQLLFEGALAMLSIVLVTFLMWYFVNRITNQSKVEESADEPHLPPSHAQTIELR